MLISLILVPLLCLSQPSDPGIPGDPNENDPEATGQSTLAGVNYSAFIHVNESYLGTPFHIEVENMVRGLNVFVVAGTALDGVHFSETINVTEGEKILIDEAYLADVQHITILSLNAFRVTTSEPVIEVIRETKIPTVTPPRIWPMRTWVVVDNGTTAEVVVDAKNRVHYPIYGRVIGDYNPNNEKITLLGGRVLATQK